MKVCATCRKELTCIKTGMDVIVNAHYSYRGDLYQCGICRCKVAFCNPEGNHSERPFPKTEYDVELKNENY